MMQHAAVLSPSGAVRRPTGSALAKDGGRSRAWAWSYVPALLFLGSLVSPFIGFEGHGIRSAWICFPVWLVVAFAERPASFRRVGGVIHARRFELFWLACWNTAVVASFLAGRGFASDLHVIFLLTFDMVVALDLVYAARGRRAHDILSSLLVFGVGVGVIVSLPVLLEHSGLARQVMDRARTPEIVLLARNAGVGTYAFYTALAIALPVAVAMALQRRWFLRWLFLALAVGMALAILASTFTGAALLLGIGIATFLLATLARSRARGRVIAALAVVGFLAVFGWYSLLQGSTQWNFIQKKVSAMTSAVSERGLVAGVGSASLRLQYWEVSARTIVERPLFGWGATFGRENPDLYVRVGGHSSWLDLPAEYGIPAFIAYLLFLVSALRRAVRTAGSPGGRAARAASCLAFVVCGAVNPVVFLSEFFVLFQFVVLGGGRAEDGPGEACRR
jgi:O-antigen ligase